MKKLMSLLLVFVLSLVLVACNDPVVSEEPTNDEASQPTTGGEENINDGLELKPGVPVVTFCTWSFGTAEEFNMTRRTIAKFNADHDDVQIQIVEPEGDYDTFLTTKASARELPDVFMVNSVPKAVINYLAADITSLTAADSEWATVDSALTESVTYNGKVYGIPAGQYYMGFFANMTLLAEYVAENEYADEVFAAGSEAFTTERFISTVKSMRKVTGITDATGVVGVNATGDMINWLPGALDTTGNIKHFVWNSSTLKFDYRSDVMYDALRIIADLGSKTGQYTFDSVASAGEAENVFGTGSAWDAFKGGKVGFVQSGTWENFEDARGFDVEFVGYPGQRVISASDYMCVSRFAKNPELAFKVAKYLTYGEEGYQARFDIIDEEKKLDPKTPLSVTGLPVVNNAEIAAKWFEYVKLDGVEEVYNKVVAGEIELIVEGNKSIPGFQDARFQGSTGLSYEGVRGGAVLNMSDFIWDVCSGDITVDQYMTDMKEALAAQLNKYVTDAYAQIAAVAE